MTTTMENATAYALVEEAIRYLEEHYLEQVSLTDLAEQFELSPFHFQRIFSEWAGVSPKKFMQCLTVGFLKDRLKEPGSIFEVAMDAGLSSQSRVYDLFTTLEAVTPDEYRLQGIGLRIQFGFHETPFGRCLIGVTDRGICWMAFLHANLNDQAALKELRTHWSESMITENHEATGNWIKKIFSNTATDKRLHLFVRGTNFQVKVWQALLEIPSGAVTTYQEIARQIQQPRALQAVGHAVGSNPIAYLIPCHRVIRKTGIIGEYRWDRLRKKSMLGWEMTRSIPD